MAAHEIVSAVPLPSLDKRAEKIEPLFSKGGRGGIWVRSIRYAIL